MKPITWGILLLVFGVLLLLQNFEVVDVGDVIATCWPILLVLWGWAILRRYRKPLAAAAPPAPANGASGATPGTPAGSAPPAPDGMLMHESHVFDNMYSRVTSKNFKGGSVSTIFGSALIDLSEAAAAEGEHLFTIHSMFGDTRIVLPAGMAFSITVNTILGKAWLLGQRKGGFASEVRHTTEQYGSAPAKLSITVSKIFGDVIIEQKS
jgi:hypothetical protein